LAEVYAEDLLGRFFAAASEQALLIGARSVEFQEAGQDLVTSFVWPAAAPGFPFVAPRFLSDLAVQEELASGVALVKRDALPKDELSDLKVAIRESRGNPVRSWLPESFSSLMRFLQAVTADRGEVTLGDLGGAVRHTLRFLEQP